MGLILCICCDYQRELPTIPKKQYVCSNCGCRHPRLIRRKVLPAMVLGGDRPGRDPDLARHQAFAGLKGYEQRRGYSQWWAYMKFKTLFGRKPNGEAKEPPAPAGHELLGWIRRQNKAWARTQPKRQPVLPLPESLSPLMSDDDWEEL